jgi:hypothetical protein
MASDDDERLSGGMATSNVTDTGGGGDAAVSATVSAVSAPPGTQVPRSAQPLSAAGGSIGGESVLVVSARLVINVQTSREAIRAVGARVAALRAERAASVARVIPVTLEVDMHDGSAEFPRPSFNRQWLNVVIAYTRRSQVRWQVDSATDS